MHGVAWLRCLGIVMQWIMANGTLPWLCYIHIWIGQCPVPSSCVVIMLTRCLALPCHPPRGYFLAP